MMFAKTLEELAAVVDGRVIGDGSASIKGVAPIEEAGPGDITFVADRKYLKFVASTRASAVIVRDEMDAGGKNLLVVRNPQSAFSRIIDILRPPVPPPPGVHPKAEVHAGAVLGKDVSVQAFTVIEEGARIGDRSVFYPGVYVGRGAKIGSDVILYPGVSVREGCVIGDRVIVHSNAVIGSDGFGYYREGARYFKIPQRGIVRIEDDVELGACVTVDRAALGETVIGRGTKIDNLSQVAHNVVIGEDTIIISQTGIAGSTRVGSRVQLGGQVGVVGHIEIGDNSMVGAKSGIVQDVPAGSVLSGIPAIPHAEWLRAQSVYAKLPELKKRVAELEKRLESLEGKKGKSP